MKKQNFLYGILGILMLSFSLTSCVTDQNPPIVSLLSGTDVLTSSGKIEPSSNFKVQVKALKGDVNMKTLTIFENGAKLPLERIVDGLNANPALLSGTDVESFTKTITIKAQTTGVSDYLFVVEDDNLLKDTVMISLTGSTAFNVNVASLKVYNADAPAGYFGSVDLQKGEAVASKDNPDGDIQDFGVVSTSPPYDGTWQKKIKPENGTEMVLPTASVTFADIDDMEKLIVAYNAGTKATEASVTVGKVFLFKSPSKTAGKFDYFIINTLELHETPPSNLGGDNLDYYIFALKGKKY
jgi:hypothetical protein